MPISKAQQRAVAKYSKENYDAFLVRFRKGHKALIKAHADAVGQSINGYVEQAVDERIERDNADSAMPSDIMEYVPDDDNSSQKENR